MGLAFLVDAATAPQRHEWAQARHTITRPRTMRVSARRKGEVKPLVSVTKVAGENGFSLVTVIVSDAAIKFLTAAILTVIANMFSVR